MVTDDEILGVSDSIDSAVKGVILVIVCLAITFSVIVLTLNWVGGLIK